ncbi:MAG: hypothetical protein ACI8PZ_006626 [Myxococcota bacterium]|jgi:hypothetical protein
MSSGTATKGTSPATLRRLSIVRRDASEATNTTTTSPRSSAKASRSWPATNPPETLDWLRPSVIAWRVAARASDNRLDASTSATRSALARVAGRATTVPMHSALGCTQAPRPGSFAFRSTRIAPSGATISLRRSCLVASCRQPTHLREAAGFTERHLHVARWPLP